MFLKLEEISDDNKILVLNFESYFEEYKNTTEESIEEI